MESTARDLKKRRFFINDLVLLFYFHFHSVLLSSPFFDSFHLARTVRFVTFLILLFFPPPSSRRARVPFTLHLHNDVDLEAFFIFSQQFRTLWQLVSITDFPLFIPPLIEFHLKLIAFADIS